jgi:hypothetical protein
MATISVRTQKLSELATEYFHSFDRLTEKHTLRPALKYLKTECEQILSQKDIEKAKASKTRAELVLSGARMRLNMLEEGA